MFEACLPVLGGIISGGIVGVFSACVVHTLAEARTRKEKHLSALKEKIIKPLFKIFRDDLKSLQFRDRYQYINFGIIQLDFNHNTGEIKFLTTKDPMSSLLEDELYKDLNNHFPELYTQLDDFHKKFLKYVNTHRTIAQYFWNKHSGKIFETAERVVLAQNGEILVRNKGVTMSYSQENIQKELLNIWMTHNSMFGLRPIGQFEELAPRIIGNYHAERYLNDLIDDVKKIGDELSEDGKKVLQLLQTMMEQQKLSGKCKYI